MEVTNESSGLLPEMSPQRKREHAERRNTARERLRRAQQTAVISKLFDKAASKKKKSGVTPSRQEIALQEAQRRSRHSFLYTMLNPSSQQRQAVIFKRVITVIILTDLLLFVLSTDPKLLRHHEAFFHITEGIASTLFLAEYVARVVVITEKKVYRRQGPFWGRIAYICTAPAIIDLLAAAPFFLEIPTGWQLPTLTYLRFFRLFRILKTEAFMRALDAVYRVIYYNREILYVAATLCIFLVLVTSVLLYYLRPANPKDQEDFKSIAATLFLSIMMLTGQGGPDGPLPWYTKLIVVLTSVFSVAMFAIPASMLTWGFEAEAERMAKRQRIRFKRSQSGEPSSEEDESSEDLDTTDEEYFKIIAGEDLEDEEKEDPVRRRLREAFETADKDMDGTLSLSEYIRLQQPATSSDDLQRHVRQVEAQAQANSEKLDQILRLLQQRK